MANRNQLLYSYYEQYTIRVAFILFFLKDFFLKKSTSGNPMLAFTVYV